MRLTRGRAADGGASSKRTDPPRRAELKTTCPKAWVLSRESLARSRSSLRLKIRPSAPSPPPPVRPPKIGGDRGCRLRIALAHKEAVYQRLLLEAVTHRGGSTQIQRPYRTCPSSRVNRREPLTPHTRPFISHFRRTRGFLVVLLAQTSFRRVFSRRDSPSSPLRRACNEIRPVTVKRSR